MSGPPDRHLYRPRILPGHVSTGGQRNIFRVRGTSIAIASEAAALLEKLREASRDDTTSDESVSDAVVPLSSPARASILRTHSLSSSVPVKQAAARFWSVYEMVRARMSVSDSGGVNREAFVEFMVRLYRALVPGFKPGEAAVECALVAWHGVKEGAVCTFTGLCKVLEKHAAMLCARMNVKEHGRFITALHDAGGWVGGWATCTHARSVFTNEEANPPVCVSLCVPSTTPRDASYSHSLSFLQ
jgi:hypothetical protein